MKITSEFLREKYLGFFAERGHAVIQSASLIPENDPSVLFTTAGMHPLIPYLMGQSHPKGHRLTDVQKCVRTDDIEEVGDDSHLTFFEMLGNWSLGDYFNHQSIKWSYEFLTSKKYLGLDPDRISVTVFAGDDDAPRDEDSAKVWEECGIPKERIYYLPKKHNWWIAGTTGPCGPDTEMFYWTGPLPAPETFDPRNKLWVEIWNDVFMQYNKTADGKFEPLAQKNVDTGMGVERVTAILQGKKSCYETELFAPLFAELDQLRGVAHQEGEERSRSERIVVEHARAATFIMADGITPGKVDQAYVLRRLIRRMIREARKLGVNGLFTAKLAEVVIRGYKEFYPELEANSRQILEEFTREEEQFQQALEKGTAEFEKLIARVPAHIQNKVVSGKNAFYLYETFGFPIELTVEMAQEKGFKVDLKGYEDAYAKHQELSRKGAEQKFKGGLADHSEESAKLHTATHLLHAALRKVLGTHVAQKGSNINAERLRFDFSHPDKMTPEQIAEVERLVNEAIEAKAPVICEEMGVEEAKAQGAIGLFGDKYGEKVRVYTMGGFSKEICGGPHAANTGDLEHFRIVKEESSSRGVRRIKAVIGK